MYNISKTGTTVLNGCDYVGEKLAAFLGITTPKYNYEIEQYKKIKQEQKQMEKEDLESASWLANKNVVPIKTLDGNGCSGRNDDGTLGMNVVTTQQSQINKY